MSFLPSFDRRLVGRVKKYMNEHRRVTSDQMAEDLQVIYKNDYGRRKRNAFRKLVAQIQNGINEEKRESSLGKLESAHLNKRRKKNSDSSSSESSEGEELMEYKETNSMNLSLALMYKKQKMPESKSLPSSPYRYNIDDETQAYVAHNDSKKKAVKMQKISSPARSKNTDKTDVNGNIMNSRAGNELDFVDEEMEMNQRDFFFVDKEGSHHEKQPNNRESTILSKNTKTATETLPSAEQTSKRAKTPKLKKRPKKSTTEEADVDIKGSEKKSNFSLQTSNTKFEDVGGNEKTLKEVCKLLIHMRHPEIYTTLGVTPPCGVLLHGPPGCGKSLLASAIAGELGFPMIKLAATEIVSGVSGESEQKLREVFEMAIASAPCIIFIDEIDAITPKREIASKDMERRIVAQLLSCLDDLISASSQVMVIGATNRPDSIDPALRRAGRFDREICMGIPDERAREDILRVLCKKLKLEADFNFSLLARLTPGYVGADLMSLCREAAMFAVNRILAEVRDTIACEETESNNTRHNYDPTTHPDHCDDIVTQSELAILESLEKESLKMAENEHFTQKLAMSTKNASQENDFSSQNGPCLEKSVDAESSNSEENLALNTAMSATNTSQASNCLPQSEHTHHLSLPELLAWLRETLPLSEEHLSDLCIGVSDFENALPLVQPSAKREGFATVPDTTWDDVGALEDVREELSVAIMAPVRNPAAFRALGLTKPPGILLAGPPGCGKTLLAKAIANESGINFISVKGPELLNMYVGESERAVRQCFERARSSSPCVIFFDELDSLCPRRSGAEMTSTARVVNQMLTEMDGLEARRQVYVMAATNRPDIIDPAVLRPGRLDKTLYVGLPTAEDREKILRTITKNGTKPPLSVDVSIQDLAKDERCRRFTGADLSSLVREAAVNALKDHISNQHVLGAESDEVEENLRVEVKREHFEKAFTKVRPSVSLKDEEKYRKMRENLQE